jgi:hypothetical protein
MSFFSQLADKAQDAINKTPLAQHIPSSISGRQGGSSSSQDSSKSTNNTLNQLSHQFRSLQIQYGYSCVRSGATKLFTVLIRHSDRRRRCRRSSRSRKASLLISNPSDAILRPKARNCTCGGRARLPISTTVRITATCSRPNVSSLWTHRSH